MIAGVIVLAFRPQVDPVAVMVVAVIAAVIVLVDFIIFRLGKGLIDGERSAVRDRVTPHMFRHSVATYLLEEGVDIRYVQRLLGHRSISTTEIYTHVADSALKVRITERHPRRGIVGT